MTVVLYALGIVVGVVGLMAMGFAVPIRDFSLGNALIMAGATALVGGLTLIGLGAVLRELKRLRGAFEKVVQSARAAEVTRGGGPVRAAVPPRPAAPGSPRAARMEPQVDAPPAPEPARQEARDEARQPARLAARPPARSGLFASIRGSTSEVHVAEVPDTTSSPQAPPPGPSESSLRGAAREDTRFEPKFGSAPPAEPAAPSPASLATRTAARFEMPRATPELPRPHERTSERSPRNLFDSVWPTDSKAPAEAAPEPAAPPPPPPPAPSDREDFDERAPDARRPRHSEPVPPPEERPGILKSGVIDGMAYTLYTDGSIEAQLPQGLIRFASIDELRAHLENNS